MSKKIFIFLVAGLVIAFGVGGVLAAGPTLESGKNFTIPTGSSMIFLGSPNHNLTWTTYDGNAATASALAANPANCSAGYYPLGIAANGAVESCTLAATGGLTGSGTTNYISKWTSASAQGNSIVFDNGTNVGVSTASPAQKLDVVGNIKTTGYIIVPSGIVPAVTGAPDGKIFSPSGDYVSGTSWGINYNEGSPDYIEFNGSTGPTSKIALDNGGAIFGLNGGNVGIGIASPGSRLEVGGSVDVNGGAIYIAGTAGQTRTVLQSYSSASSLWMIQPTTQAFVLADALSWDRSLAIQYTAGTTGAAAGRLVIGQISKNAATYTHGITSLYTNGIERLRIDSAGNVGIGTTNPALGKLTVDGGSGYAIYASTASMGTAVYGGTTNSDAVGLYGNSLGTNSAGVVGSGAGFGVQGLSTAGYGVFGQSTTGYAGYFNGKGRFTGNLEALSFIYNSDRSLKKNIRTLDSSLNKILQLRGVSFDWKKDGKSSVGLIAQEVEKVYPELVSINEDGLKSVQYGNLVAPLIEAIKEQQKKIDQLETRITILEMNK